MSILSMALIAITGVVTAVILKGYKPEFSFMIILVLAFLFLGWLVSIFSDLLSGLSVFIKFYEENKFYYNVLFKIAGITYLCEFTSGICRDAGYNSISTQIEMIGKILVLLAGIPVILAVIDVITGYQI